MSTRKIGPTVYGIETEYSCMLTWPNEMVYEIVGSCHSPDSKLNLYQEPTQKGAQHLDSTGFAVELAKIGIYVNKAGMLSNGGRLYIDPSGPEYATPETTTAEEAAIRSFDGDQILLGIFASLRDAGILSGFQLNRRIVDHNRTSRGIHLNNSTKLRHEIPSPQNIAKFATLNVAKGAIFGSGGLLLNQNGETEFHHSPRLSLTQMDFNEHNLYQERLLVRTPFKEDVPGIYRVETVTSDALNFAWPLKASMVMTNALIKIIELGYADKLPELRYPVVAAVMTGQYGAAASVDIEPRGHSKTLTLGPLDIIRTIAELVLSISEKEKHLDKETAQTLPEIIGVADKMAEDMFSVADQVESVARLLAMQRKMEKNGLSLDSEKICRFDYAWDWIGGGIAETLRNRGVVGWQGIDSRVTATRETKKRMVTPPQNTRAKIRGELIRKTEGQANSSWDNLDQNNPTRFIHPLDAQTSS